MWDLLKAVKRMQSLAQELEKAVVTGEDATGKVRITLTGHQAVQSIQIAPDLLQAPDKLEKALIEAFHDARDKLQALVVEKLGGEAPFLPGMPGNIGLG
jgi:DNA-binding YbaB/EbfC family protein